MSIYDISAIQQARTDSENYYQQCDDRVNELISQFHSAARQAGTPLISARLIDRTRNTLVYPVIAQTVSEYGMSAFVVTLAVTEDGELYAIAKDFKQLLMNHCGGFVELIEFALQKALMGEPLSENQLAQMRMRAAKA